MPEVNLGRERRADQQGLRRRDHWSCSTPRASSPITALRAARAALGLQRGASATLTAQHPDWPRSRVDVNTGPAVVGNVGTTDPRSCARIGDATIHAARLPQAMARFQARS